MDVIFNQGSAENSNMCKNTPRAVMPVAHFPHQLA